MVKEVKTPKEPSVAPVDVKSPNVLLQELLKENNLVLAITPDTNIKVVSDGSIIIGAPSVVASYGR